MKIHLAVLEGIWPGGWSCPVRVEYGDRGTLDLWRVTCQACLNWEKLHKVLKGEGL